MQQRPDTLLLTSLQLLCTLYSPGGSRRSTFAVASCMCMYKDGSLSRLIVWIDTACVCVLFACDYHIGPLQQCKGLFVACRWIRLAMPCGRGVALLSWLRSSRGACL